jgi:sulfur-oxidizing protein SoxZ
VANSRIKVPTSAKVGDNVEIRAMIMHPMENGYNVDTQGTAIPVHIITDLVCTYDGAEVLRVQLQPGLSANPYFSFYLTATKSGAVEFRWTDQDGTVTTNSAMLLVT